MSNLHYCTIDFSKKGMNCNDDAVIIKYSEDVKSINDVVACTTTTTTTTTNSSASSINNNVVNANWSCNDRASCALGIGKRSDK